MRSSHDVRCVRSLSLEFVAGPSFFSWYLTNPKNRRKFNGRKRAERRRRRRGYSEIDSTKTKKKRHKSVNVRHKGRRTQHRNGPGWANDRYIDKKSRAAFHVVYFVCACRSQVFLSQPQKKTPASTMVWQLWDSTAAGRSFCPTVWLRN